ncbi:MAG TPA: serine/threonine-protein kinase [Burkholderiales bacterium]|nr:serine/threonine-protein kinase [Burkholderiales bacterium]
MATPSLSASSPRELGKYSVSEVLGKGAMGVVYKGFDPHIRRTVALKTIRKELVDEDQASTLLARFKNEAQAAGRLSHPGIVGVYEWGEAGELVFLAMEYVEGNSLREYFNRGTRFDSPDAVSVMAQLLDALHYAHQQGVWHRDIKPANIIIMKNGKLKVADFGIARIDSSNLTQTGAIMGTPGYMAPEQYSGHPVDWRADIFSAGVVLYQLLTGSRPFTGSPETIAYKICHEQPALPSEADPGRCTTQFDAVAMKALAKKPEERYQNGHAFREAILAAHAAPVSAAVSEETIINEVIRPSGHLDLSQPSQSPHASSPSSLSHPTPSLTSGSTPDPSNPAAKTIPPPGWDPAVLRQIEQQLARLVGPVAKVMVRRGATATTDVGRLYRMLADQLAKPEERTAFLAGRERLKGIAPRESEATSAQERAPATGLTMQLTPAAIEDATRKLSAYMGPIAKVVAKRAAAQSSSRRHFHTLLAESITDPKERARFLKDVGAA